MPCGSNCAGVNLSSMYGLPFVIFCAAFLVGITLAAWLSWRRRERRRTRKPYDFDDRGRLIPHR